MKNYNEIAEKIVKELKDIIGKDLNYIDVNGQIIASTDFRRIGTYHEGARIAIENKHSVIVKEDNEYKGSKKGVNLPVIFKGKIIGVIGISGDYDEVRKYGNIIKKMTEILIKEAYLNEKLMNEDEYTKIIINDLIKNTDIKNSVTLASKEFKIIKKSKDLKVFSARYKGDENKFWEYKKKILDIMKKNSKKGEMFINKNFYFIGIFIEREEESINRFFEKLKYELDMDMYVGIGGTKTTFKELHQSYSEAEKSLKWSKQIKKDRIFYSSMKYGLLLYDISEEKRKEFLKSIFSNLTEEEIENFKKIFANYEKYDGSIKKVAETLFLHKNTLQYQIIKFSEKTGFDIRKYRDFSVIKIAFLLY